MTKITEQRYYNRQLLTVLLNTTSILSMLVAILSAQISNVTTHPGTKIAPWAILFIAIMLGSLSNAATHRNKIHEWWTFIGLDTDWVLDDVDIDELAEGPVVVE